MSDLIDRQEAIDAVQSCFDVYVTNQPTLLYKEETLTALRLVPSALRKKGKWIRGDAEKLRGMARCSVCGESCYKGREYFSFCPNCGADMRGDKDG